MRKKIGLIAMLLCAATILSSCGKNVAGNYANDDGTILVMSKDNAFNIRNTEQNLLGTYVVKGDKVIFTTTKSTNSLTDESSFKVEEGTIEGDSINVKGFDKPFVKEKKK